MYRTPIKSTCAILISLAIAFSASITLNAQDVIVRDPDPKKTTYTKVIIFSNAVYPNATINQMQKEFFNGLSVELEKILKSLNKETISIIDQSGKYSEPEGIALYGSKNKADSSIVIYMESTPIPTNPKAQRIDLVLKFITFNIQFNTMTATNTLDKKFNLWTGKEWGPQLSFSDIAQDFIAVMGAQGYFDKNKPQ